MTFFRWNSGTSRHFELLQRTSAILNQVNNQSEFYAINWRDATRFDSGWRWLPHRPVVETSVSHYQQPVQEYAQILKNKQGCGFQNSVSMASGHNDCKMFPDHEILGKVAKIKRLWRNLFHFLVREEGGKLKSPVVWKGFMIFSHRIYDGRIKTLKRLWRHWL